jgi:parallel beta-helix repeat protein
VSRRHRISPLVLLAAAGVVVAVLGVGPFVNPFSADDTVKTVQIRAISSSPMTSRVVAERQSRILSDEDRRLLTLVASVRPGSPAYLQNLDGTQTLVLTAGGLSYELADLLTYGAAQVQPDGSVLITKHVFVAPGARLMITAPGSTLRLSSDLSGFVSLVAWKADLVLAGAEGQQLTVTSWDAGAQTPDRTRVDGRAYIRDVSGHMEVRYVAASNLGFWAGRTSGVAWTGSTRTEATGAITSSSFRNNHYGAFASQGEGITVTDSDFSGNDVDGLSLHRSTAETTIQQSTARNNGRHGFSADHGSESVTYTDVTAEENADYGVFFSGTPLSIGQSAGGASLRTYGQVHIAGGVLRQNGKAGLRVVDGDGVTIADTRVADNDDGIVLVGTTAPTSIESTTVSGNRRFGISVSAGTATVQGNKLSGSETAIRVRDAAVTVTGNNVREATAHAISVVGASDGSSVSDNTIGGRGPSGLDVYRVDAGVSIDLSGNDVEGWTRDRDDVTYWSTFIPNHPMLLLWVMLLGAPLLLTLRARRNQAERPGGTPYPDDIRREWAAPVRVDVGRRIPSGQL